jgi:competence protein ComEC
MVRVTLFYVTGIALAIQWPGVFTIHWLWIAGFYIPCFFLRRASGFVGLLTICLCGYLRVENHKEKADFTNVELYTVKLSRYAEEKENSWKVESSVISIYSNGNWVNRKGNVILYFSKKDFPKPYSYGDVFLIRGAPQLVKPPSNPGEFNLRRNLYFKNIHHQHYLREGYAVFIENSSDNFFLSAAIKVRLWADRQLKTYVHGAREQATASALVLGVTDGLDSDLLQAYASTGAMHVLAVSGLHVSIIYWIILLLGKPIEKLRSGKAMLACISVVLLWIYAFVTGWSPSVLRAVMMFTFVALARPWKQSTNIYNTMAASAFCLLVYDPFFLMSVGFQLSYLAVFGIVFIHPHLYVLWEPQSRFWDEVWKVTSVSVAAQIATVPISLYYFHQFPNYFLLANLLVIPASFVVLVVGLAVLPFSVIPFVASMVGFVLQWTIFIMNSVVVIIGSLPFSVIRNIYISELQACLLSSMFLCILLCLINKRVQWVWLASILAVSFSFLDWHHVVTVVRQNHITIYNINGKTSMDLISCGELSAYGPFDAFRMSTNRIRLGVQSTKILTDSIIVCHGKSIVIARSPVPENLRADILILSNNAFKTLPKSTSKILIIDSSNSPYLAERLLRQAKEQGINVYSVAHSGAFQYSF